MKVAYRRSTATHKTSHCRLFSLRALRPSCLGYARRQNRLLHLSAAARGKSYWNPWEGKVIISVTSFPNNRVKLWRCMFTGQACQNFLMFLFIFFLFKQIFPSQSLRLNLTLTTIWHIRILWRLWRRPFFGGQSRSVHWWNGEEMPRYWWKRKTSKSKELVSCNRRANGDVASY